METLPLEFASDDRKTGFRLDYFEVFNWGTFDKAVWKIDLDSNNGLLTGDIGSGKSTSVDALTTLLVPHQRIVYNKAAGGETKERSLYSYIRGEYKSEKDETSHTASAVYLRSEKTFSVLLARFCNIGLAQEVTLAQVFWLKDGKRNPERFFVCSSEPLSIQEHFTVDGLAISKLRKHLRLIDHVEVFDSFKEYSRSFRRTFGIKSEKALDLFHQTVSLKSVANLGTFVKSHMLEEGGVQERIYALQQNFQNLQKAYEAVVRAKEQVALLEPLLDAGTSHDEKVQHRNMLTRCREYVPPYFAREKAKILEKILEKLRESLVVEEQNLTRVKRRMAENSADRQAHEQSIQSNGGGRIQEIQRECGSLERTLESEKKRRENYNTLLDDLELAEVVSDSDFFQRKKTIEMQREKLVLEMSKLDEQKTQLAITSDTMLKEKRALEHEVASLRERRSNIPLANMTLRDSMCEALHLQREDLPFIGELLAVRDDAKEWEGAAERVLRNFALSILVAEGDYPAVLRYVNSNHLRQRIVYYKAATHVPFPSVGSSANSLYRKLQVNEQSLFANWLHRELLKRFDYVCAESLQEFQREKFALSRQGQIKAGGVRHEKDDRYLISDRASFVLGWNNQGKIKLLETQLAALIRKEETLLEQMNRIQQGLMQFQTRKDCMIRFLTFDNFSDIDWRGTKERIASLLSELRQIEEGSDILQELRMKLQLSMEAGEVLLGEHETCSSSIGKLTSQIANNQLSLDVAMEECADLHDDADYEMYANEVHAIHAKEFKGLQLTASNCDTHAKKVTFLLNQRIDAESRKITTLSNSIVSQMKDFRMRFPAESKELGQNPADLPEYRVLNTALCEEDLPKLEERFKELLNKNTIQGVALFQSQLEQEVANIEQKIKEINRSLAEIEYNRSTYIQLVLDATADREIQEFRHDLRQCLAHGLDDDDLYNERKFLQVKALIDRFNGRANSLELDARWTKKVTDVRNWFTYAASERWLEDHAEKEYYSGSSGKSGGQKEKLAYTILASALAYQFGLEWQETRSRSFRFVVIDEAFGRGSDESTRYALELFKRLHLQLLVVTPLQKIPIIESYVNSVHYVVNPEGNASLLRSLSMHEYQAERDNVNSKIGSLPASAIPK